MKRISISVMALILIVLLAVSAPAIAYAAGTETPGAGGGAAAVETGAEDSVLSAKAVSAAIVVGLASAAGAIGMAIAIAKSAESMARQPEMASKINSAMMLGLVFIETAIIYALIIAILIIFVL